MTYPKLGAALARAAKNHGRPSPWYSCSWPDYVADELCGHQRKAPCVPLQQIAATCDSARVWDDISDAWNQPEGNGVGVKNYLDFFASNPQLALLRNSLPPAFARPPTRSRRCHRRPLRKRRWPKRRRPRRGQIQEACRLRAV